MNLTGSNGRLRKHKRQTQAKKLGSSGLGALVETHNSFHLLQQILLYTAANQEVEQQFWVEGVA
jgi:hypothetical protein